jgi:hypothetical protein
VTLLLADFATVWRELFPAEQARIVQLLVERVDVQEEAIEVRIRVEGLASLVGEIPAAGGKDGGMIESAETRLDGSTLVVRIPMCLRVPRRPKAHRRARRQRNRADLETAAGRYAGQSARTCYRWQRVLESGQYGTLAELSAAEQISRSYICRVLGLILLAPEIVERILDGRPTAGLAQFLRPFPVEWERQREWLL